MGVTNHGYERPELDEIRDSLNDKAQSLIGDDASVDDAHLLGQFLGILSYLDDKIEKALEAVFYSRYILKSHADVLDNSAYEESVYRKPAAPSIVTLQIDGYIGGIVESESMFSTDDGILFMTTDEVDFKDVTMIDDPDNPGTQMPLTDDDGESLSRQTVQAEAVEPGPDGNVAVGAVTYSADGTIDVASVTNPEPATGGQTEENDTDYQARTIADRKSGNASTENGLETAIESVDGVLQARAVGNNKLVADEYGNPAKSTHLYVIGGNDQDIADVYFNSYGITTYTVGEVAVDEKNDSGDTRTIKFSRAKAIPIYASVTLITNDDFDTDGGVAAIKSNPRRKRGLC